jgi:hypothetical protein
MAYPGFWVDWELDAFLFELLVVSWGLHLCEAYGHEPSIKFWVELILSVVFVNFNKSCYVQARYRVNAEQYTFSFHTWYWYQLAVFVHNIVYTFMWGIRPVKLSRLVVSTHAFWNILRADVWASSVCLNILSCFALYYAFCFHCVLSYEMHSNFFGCLTEVRGVKPEDGWAS